MNVSAIGLSGLLAAQARLNGTASNIANTATTGPVPATPPEQPIVKPATGPSGDQVYQALQPETQASSGGGVSRLAPGLPSYVQQFQPDSPDANAQGLIAAPATDLTAEATSQIADAAYAKANLVLLQVDGEIQKDTVNLKA